MSCDYALYSYFFFFNDTATTEIYTLSLHDALPISREGLDGAYGFYEAIDYTHRKADESESGSEPRSEEHTSELQSLAYLVCRLLLEKKKKTQYPDQSPSSLTREWIT